MNVVSGLSFDSLIQSLETADVLADPIDSKKHELANVIEKKQSRKLYAMLEKMDGPLPFDWVNWNYGAVGRKALLCSLRAFDALLKKSRLNEEMLAHLLMWAAELDRPDHLSLVLERLRAAGGNMKQAICGPEETGFGAMPANALAVAVRNKNLRCVRLLLQAPEAEPVWPPQLLELWVEGEKGDAELDRCLKAVARAWLPGQTAQDGHVPLAPGLELCQALLQDNLSLALRIIQTEGVELEQARKALDEYGGILARPEYHGLLSRLFTAWPQLLRRRWPTLVLVMAALLPREGPSPELEPWLSRLRRRKWVPLAPGMERIFYQYQQELEIWNLDWYKLLERWRQRLGDRPAPALLRNAPVYDLDFQETWPILLKFCQITGAIPKHKASRLAQHLVQFGTVRQVREALAPGGILVGENLAWLAQERIVGSPSTKRAMLLAWAR